MKKWQIISKNKAEDVITFLRQNRGLTLHPPDPYTLTPKDVGIHKKSLTDALTRIHAAIKNKESIVVYADYDADGITAGAIMWETLHALGAQVMPYIPHRVDEGYGLSQKGIDAVKAQYNPTLIITVDHGITAWEKVAYAKSLGIEVIITDHHTKPEKLPDCIIVHTTGLCGAGVSWFVAKELSGQSNEEHVALASVGTIADLVPLVGVNRSIVKYGLAVINNTKRVGLNALIREAGLIKGALSTYDISHVLGPRLNAMGRLVHAMDALRLLCTRQEDKAMFLAEKLGVTNRDRQKLTEETVTHACEVLQDTLLRTQESVLSKKLIFVSHESYNPGIIGLVAGKLVEEFYRPSVVLSKGELISKGSARSIAGFNIVEAIKSCSDILIDVGGHPMAAGFTVETKYLEELEHRLLELADKELDEEKLTRSLRIDAEIPLSQADEELWTALRDFEPFGIGNPEPVFSTSQVEVLDSRLVGKDGKHMKLKIRQGSTTVDAIAFGLGSMQTSLRDKPVDIAYCLDMNTWNGNTRLQLKIKDIRV